MIIFGISLLYLQNEPQFVLEPMSKEDLEVTIQNGKQIVDAKKDGYQLILDPSFQVETREIESGRVMIYKGNCRAVVIKIDNTEGKTVQQWFENDQKDMAWENSIGVGLDVNDYHLEKISDTRLEVYVSFLTTEQFGLEKEILIQGKHGIFSITQTNPNNTCFPVMEILDGFYLKNND